MARSDPPDGVAPDLTAARRVRGLFPRYPFIFPIREEARGGTTLAGVSRVFTISVASVYPHYVAKVEKKGRTRAELDQVILWLTGFDESALGDHLSAGTTFEDFFADAHLNPNAPLITGVVCRVRVEDIGDPLMQHIRYLDKLVDELSKGRPMDKILRVQPT